MTYINRHTVLSFLAHPDDAEILCGGTLIRLQELGWDVHIATAIHDNSGSATLPANEIAAIRCSEGAATAQLIGATYHCLKERDVNVIFNKAVNRKVIDLFREISPSLVFTHPRHDYMLDYEQVHLLARSATCSFPIPNPSALPMVQNAAMPWLWLNVGT
jgi:LmbE family N-acetylglucosaminyl deacetylase